MAFSLIVNALSAFIPNTSWYLTVVILSRILQGLASSLINTTCYSISGKLYKDQQAKVISLLEMSVGLGMTSSPLMGTVLFDLGGYMAPFFFYAII
jgi:MFS family permease